nr:MAG TPA: hypothetical protein [Caudoviricetes sp.]
MKHGLEQLTKRMRFNREHNISFDGEDLMSEAKKILSFTAARLLRRSGATLKTISSRITTSSILTTIMTLKSKRLLTLTRLSSQKTETLMIFTSSRYLS